MGVVKQMDIKNRTYYFYNNMINIKNFDPILLKIDEKSYKDIGTYNIGYITIKKDANKYLIFDSTDENKELLKKHNDVWDGIRYKIEEVSSDECDYGKDYIKI